MKKLESINETLIYKKTVYSLKVKVNKKNLTREGYFNLSKIRSLRIVDNGFLKRIRNDFSKTQKELSNLIQVPLRTWIGWESYQKAIPFDSLILLFKSLNFKEIIWLNLIKNSHFTLGTHHGGDRTILPLKPDDFTLYPYLIPNGIFRVYVVKHCPKDIRQRIIKEYNIDK